MKFVIKFNWGIILIGGWMIQSCAPPAAEPETPPVETHEFEEPNPQALKHFMDAQLYINQENFSMAVIELQEALEMDPNVGAIHVSLAESFWNLGKIGKSESHLKSALTLNPADSDALELLANQYVVIRKYSKAEAMFIRLTQLEDARSDYSMGLAELYMIIKRPEDAMETFLTAYYSFPDRLDALEQAAQLSLRLKDLNKAQEIFGKLILVDAANSSYMNSYVDLVILNDREEDGIAILKEVNSKYGPSEERLSHIASLYYRSNNPDEAKQILNSIKMEYGLSSTVVSLLTSIYFEASEYDSASKYSNEFIKHFANEPGGYINRALVAVNLGNHDKAIEVLLPVSEKFVDNYSVQYILGSAYHSLALEKQAEHYLLISLKIYPESKGVKHILAILYDSQNRWEESDSLYNELVSSDSSDAQALNNYAYSLAERGFNLERALALAMDAIELEPENSAYLDTVGWIYFKLGKLKLALKYIQESVAIENTNAVVLEHLGDVLTSDDRLSEAVDFYKKAFELDQKNTRLKEKAFPE